LGKRSKKINKKIKKALFSQTGPFSQTKNKLIKQNLWGSARVLLRNTFEALIISEKSFPEKSISTKELSFLKVISPLAS